MTTITARRARGTLPALAASLCLAPGLGLVLLGSGASAQGYDFFQQLFGVPQGPPRYDPYAGGLPRQDMRQDMRRERAEERRARRAAQRKPDARYAALPQGDSPAIPGNKQVVDQRKIQEDPGAALLKDPTLRAGDIVMMPSGPKVFTGLTAKTHRPHEFEDVRHSRRLDPKTRAMLVALMVPFGAMTPDQARKAMTVRLKLAGPEEREAAETVAGPSAPPAAGDGPAQSVAAAPRVIPLSKTAR